MNMTTVAKLQPGDAFRVDLLGLGHLDYRLIYVNDCRAYVEPLERSRKVIARKDPLADLLGETVLAEFDAPGGRVNIAPLTQCTPIIEEEHAVTKTVNNIVVGKKADVHHDPQTPKRSLRQKTVRADMLAVLLGGEHSVEAIAVRFGMKRSLVLAHVWEMWNCHGYGYTVTGDTIVVEQPSSVDVEDLL